jgi:hypothetical protein
MAWLNDWNAKGILEEVVPRQCWQWKYITDHSPTCKSFCSRWKPLAARNGIPERHWESADGRIQISQVVLPQRRVNGMLRELPGAPLGGQLGVNKNMNEAQQMLLTPVRNDVEKLCQKCNTCTASHGPQTKNQVQTHQYNVRVPFERVAIDAVGPFPQSGQGNLYHLITVDWLPSGQKPTVYQIKWLCQW